MIERGKKKENNVNISQGSLPQAPRPVTDLRRIARKMQQLARDVNLSRKDLMKETDELLRTAYEIQSFNSVLDNLRFATWLNAYLKSVGLRVACIGNAKGCSTAPSVLRYLGPGRNELYAFRTDHELGERKIHGGPSTIPLLTTVLAPFELNEPQSTKSPRKKT